MRWLHLSDLHAGRPDQSYQITALNSLVDAVATALDGQTVDAIFLTGDLANAGKEDQYDNVARTLLGPLRRIAGCNDATIYCVPGNHDLDCDLSLPPTWEHLGANRQKIFFEETDEAARLRAPRAASFAAYRAFLLGNSLKGVDPARNVSQSFCQRVDGASFHIITTNTSLFCDKELEDRERIPSPDGSLRTVLQSLPATERVIVLGHHPIHWFLPHARSPFKQLLLQHRAIYLHGHTHELEVQFSAYGVESLGFGAAYQAPQNALPKPYYRNTFALCTLGEQLHVAPYHWDQENGRWTATTTLPPGFIQRSSLVKDGWSFVLAKAAAGPILGMPARATLRGPVVRLTPAGQLNPADWASFLVYSRLLAADVTEDKLTPKSDLPGIYSFEYELPAGLHFLRCISSPGSHLSRAEIEDINTRLDTEGYASYTVISLGTISDDADTTYLRLKSRKAIVVHTAKDIAARLSSMGAFSEHLSNLDTAMFDNEFALASGGRPLLIVQEKVRLARFYVVDDQGNILPEEDARVSALRKARPELARTEYRPPSRTGGQAKIESTGAFDRLRYLQACKGEFSAVKYAPLATLGLRFHGITLEDLYVETGADVGAQGASFEVIAKALDDLFQSAQLDPTLRKELTEAAVRNVRGQGGQEYGSARMLYQQFGSVAVLGDPGSGKSCFVKREVLAYCEPKAGSWYEHHTPLFVPLAEVAREVTNSEPDMLAIGAKLAARRGCPVDCESLEQLFAMGLLALFFDGLDEVVSVEVRSMILASIKGLMERGRSLGNRFVVTSRPAAIHRVELPKNLDLLRMRGLTDTEMKLLAERILAARISETRGAVRLDIEQLTSVDHSILEQLLADCRAVPGIDRLARNPLFLTLLVMIYANSGAASARRHRVYQQAITTLVSIRAREAGQRGLSESDLRSRLGAVALDVFKDPKGTLPSFERVLEQIRAIVERERGTSVQRDEIAVYMQDVAEATGLLVLNREGSVDGNPTVTFMHHSFLEYYAAIGLSSGGYLEQLPSIARIPRWRDVITLLAGIVGDNGDLGPLVDTLLRSHDKSESLTFDRTVLALDCALETDVPPERVIRALLSHISGALTTGPLLHDVGLRSEVGRRLGKLMSASGSPLCERFFIDGLRAEDEDLAAAYLDLLGYACMEVVPGHAVVQAYDDVCERAGGPARVAVCGAAARSHLLRSDQAIGVVVGALSGSKVAQEAALEAINSAPSLGISCVDRLAQGVDDSSLAIAEMSARALLKVGLPLDEASYGRIGVLTRSIRRIAESASLELANDLALNYEREEVDRLLGSGDRESRVLGIRLLPWVRGDEQYVHDRLMQFVKSREREERVAALGSLRISVPAQKLITVPDAYVIRALMKAEETKDVRLASARVLGTFLFEDADVAREITSYARDTQGTSQYAAALSIVAWFGDRQEVAESFLLDEAERLLLDKKPMSKERARDVLTILEKLRSLDADGSAALVAKLQGVVGDFRYDGEIRRAALCALVGVCPVDKAMQFVTERLQAAPGLLGAAVALAGERLAARCRKRLAHIRVVYPQLSSFEEALVQHYERSIVAPGIERSDLVSATRSALVDLRYMFNSYREFAQRNGEHGRGAA